MAHKIDTIQKGSVIFNFIFIFC